MKTVMQTKLTIGVMLLLCCLSVSAQKSDTATTSFSASSSDRSSILGISSSWMFYPLKQYVATTMGNVELVYGKSTSYGLFTVGITGGLDHNYFQLGTEYYFYQESAWTAALSTGIFIGALPPRSQSRSNSDSMTTKDFSEWQLASGGTAGVIVMVRLSSFLSGVFGTKLKYFSALSDFTEGYEDKLFHAFYIGIRFHLI